MDELCDMFNETTLIIPEDEYTILQNITEKCENLKVCDTFLFFEEMYQLLKRYKVYWLNQPEKYHKGITKGTELFIHNYETLQYETNLDRKYDIKIYILYCITKSILKLIHQELENIEITSETDECGNYDEYHDLFTE